VTLVTDASTVVGLLVGRIAGGSQRALFEGEELVAPALIDAEVVSALAGLERGGKLSPARCLEAMADLAELPLERRPLEPLLGTAWSLRHNLSLYDAFYVAVARQLDCPLVTRDGRLARAPDLGVDLIRPR
jgi:predicted nucleic acid-binding protein